MFNPKLLRIVAAILIATAFAACRIPNVIEERAEPRVMLDDLGRTVKIPGKVTRVVSLAPSLTESIYAVGAGDRLVGVTTYCNYPDAAKTVAKVGDTINPNIEAILALRPEIVFVTTASQIETFTKTLEAQGTSVFVTNPKNLEGVMTNLRQLGDIFGTTERTATLLNELQERIAGIDEDVRDRKRPKTFVQISKSPLFTVGADSFIGEIVARAGGELATKGIIDKPFAQISGETALALNPDAIVLSDSEDNREPNEAFKNSNAVRNKKIIRVNADIISRPTPRLVDALEEISEALK